MELNLHKAMLRTRDRKKYLDKKRIIDMGIQKIRQNYIEWHQKVSYKGLAQKLPEIAIRYM